MLNQKQMMLDDGALWRRRKRLSRCLGTPAAIYKSDVLIFSSNEFSFNT